MWFIVILPLLAAAAICMLDTARAKNFFLLKKEDSDMVEGRHRAAESPTTQILDQGNDWILTHHVLDPKRFSSSTEAFEFLAGLARTTVLGAPFRRSDWSVMVPAHSRWAGMPLNEKGGISVEAFTDFYLDTILSTRHKSRV